MDELWTFVIFENTNRQMSSAHHLYQDDYDLMTNEREYIGELSLVSDNYKSCRTANGRQRSPIECSANKDTGSFLCMMYVNGPCFHHLERVAATPGASVESDGARD